jgi:hypothetical protein
MEKLREVSNGQARVSEERVFWLFPYLNGRQPFFVFNLLKKY